ncbi:hypothetical protein VRK_15500 [Vibrio sp. MEBiC08052]|nr:hypothetical protein VRK_15500 [Vibrio sp. MEBiC08052]
MTISLILFFITSLISKDRLSPKNSSRSLSQDIISIPENAFSQ